MRRPAQFIRLGCLGLDRQAMRCRARRRVHRDAQPGPSNRTRWQPRAAARRRPGCRTRRSSSACLHRGSPRPRNGHPPPGRGLQHHGLNRAHPPVSRCSHYRERLIPGRRRTRPQRPVHLDIREPKCARRPSRRNGDRNRDDRRPARRCPRRAVRRGLGRSTLHSHRRWRRRSSQPRWYPPLPLRGTHGSP
jgi:hypothetical protein